MSKTRTGKDMFSKRPRPSKVCSRLGGAHIFTFLASSQKPEKARPRGSPKPKKNDPKCSQKAYKKNKKKHVPKKLKIWPPSFHFRGHVPKMFRKVPKMTPPKIGNLPFGGPLGGLGGLWVVLGFQGPKILENIPFRRPFPRIFGKVPKHA